MVYCRYIRIVKSNVSSVGSSSGRLSPTLETLDFTIRIYYISICISTLPTQHTTFTSMQKFYFNVENIRLAVLFILMVVFLNFLIVILIFFKSFCCCTCFFLSVPLWCKQHFETADTPILPARMHLKCMYCLWRVFVLRAVCGQSYRCSNNFSFNQTLTNLPIHRPNSLFTIFSKVDNYPANNVIREIKGVSLNKNAII